MLFFQHDLLPFDTSEIDGNLNLKQLLKQFWETGCIHF